MADNSIPVEAICERLYIARESAWGGLALIPDGQLSPEVEAALSSLLETICCSAAIPTAIHVQAAQWHLEAAQGGRK